MYKKIVAVFGVLGAAYIGGSYYVGVRAEEQLLAMMNDAQARSNNQLAWEEVDISHGVFASTGSMALVLNQVKLDDNEPVRARIDYTIHHHLLWSRVAHFVWSATPDGLLTEQLQSVYAQVPSLTGDGTVDWAGVATSSVAFPGIDSAQLEDATLTVSPLAGQLVAGQNAFELTLSVSEFSVVDGSGPERLQMKQIAYEARSSDVGSGAVSVALAVGEALAIDEGAAASSLTDYRWRFDLEYANDVLSFDTQKTISSLTAMGSEANNIEVSLGVEGLHRDDLTELSVLIDDFDGRWLALSAAEQARLQQLGLSVLAHGVTVRAPSIKADIQLLGQDTTHTVGIEGFSLFGRVTDPGQGVGQVSLTLGKLMVPEFLQVFVPAIDGLGVEVANDLVGDRTDLRVKKSLTGLVQGGQSVRDVAFEARLKGLMPHGLFALIDLAREVDGDMSELTPEQQALVTQIMQEAASAGLVFEVPVLKATADTRSGQVDSILLEGLDIQVKLDDPLTGAGKASLLLKQLLASGAQMADVPNISDYKLIATNQVVDGKADYQIDKSIESFDSAMVKVGPSELSVRLTGLLATDLQRLFELMPAFESGLSDEQAAELAQIVRRSVASGFDLSIPRLQLTIDDAVINGQGQASLTGLGNAPLAMFDLARLAQLEAQVDLVGQSPWLDPFVQQGLVLGLLSSEADMAKGRYQFKDGQLTLNGVVLPTGQFLPMANLMVQQMLARGAQSQQFPDSASELGISQKRRGRQ